MLKFKQGAFCVLIAAAFSGEAIASPCDGTPVSMPAIVPDTPLTLNMTLMQIRHASPNVRRAALETHASMADADQAGRRLNPSIGLEIENFTGSGALSGFDQTETTLAVEQTFQLGGKRDKRERAARARAALADAQCGAILRETELEASLLFYELVAASELTELALESAELANSLVTIVSLRVDAGAAAPPERSRAITDAAALEAQALAAEAQIDRLRYELAALWGSSAPVFGLPIPNQHGLPNMSPGDGDVMKHPSLVAAKASADARDAEQIAARAAGVPDLTVSAGVRRFEETGDRAFLVGVSVPIPLFDRNRDAARAAGSRAIGERISAVAVETRLRSQQQAAVASVRASQARLNLLQEKALPAARSSYDASVQGYRAGRFNLTTTLDARKGLIEVGISIIDARRTLNADQMRLKSLIGAAPFNGDFQ